MSDLRRWTGQRCRRSVAGSGGGFSNPKCIDGQLFAVVSNDGSAYEAEKCDVCGCRWTNDPPLESWRAPEVSERPE